MATTVSYSASMRTRKTSSASNAKSSAASQEYYENTYGNTAQTQTKDNKAFTFVI